MLLYFIILAGIIDFIFFSSFKETIKIVIIKIKALFYSKQEVIEDRINTLILK